MILPTRIIESFTVPMPRLSDGLYYVDHIVQTKRQLGFYLGGWLWGIQAFTSTSFVMYYVNSYYNRVSPEILLEFVNHNTPECLDILLYVLPDPSILFDPDFPTL